MPGDERIGWTHALQGDRSLAGIPRVAVTALAVVGDSRQDPRHRIQWLYRQADHTEDFVRMEKYLNGAPRPVRPPSATTLARGSQLAAQIVEFQTGIPNSCTGGLSV
jgi:hypothetical protein